MPPTLLFMTELLEWLTMAAIATGEGAGASVTWVTQRAGRGRAVPRCPGLRMRSRDSSTQPSRSKRRSKRVTISPHRAQLLGQRLVRHRQLAAHDPAGPAGQPLVQPMEGDRVHQRGQVGHALGEQAQHQVAEARANRARLRNDLGPGISSSVVGRVATPFAIMRLGAGTGRRWTPGTARRADPVQLERPAVGGRRATPGSRLRAPAGSPCRTARSPNSTAPAGTLTGLPGGAQSRQAGRHSRQRRVQRQRIRHAPCRAARPGRPGSGSRAARRRGNSGSGAARVRCIACMASMRCPARSECFCAMRLTLALARRRLRHRPTSSPMSAIEKPSSRERLMKRSVCTSASLYWR